MDFPSLIRKKDYEQIKYVLRRHPATFIPVILLFLVLSGVPVALYFMFSIISPGVLESEVLYPLAVLLACVYYLGIYLFFFVRFVEYYLDMWIVTNDRVVDIEQLGLFSRTVSELDLFRIQDVTTDVSGFFATLFHFGNVSVKTASANVNIVFRNVHHPNKVREDLILFSHEDRKYHYGAGD